MRFIRANSKIKRTRINKCPIGSGNKTMNGMKMIKNRK